MPASLLSLEIESHFEWQWSLLLCVHIFDRPNYSKLPVYCADMNNLPQNQPLVHQEFINRSNYSVNPFCNVSTDLEQSIARDLKTKGRIVRITIKEQGALEHWFLTIHQRAATTTALKDTCDVQDYVC